MAVRHLKWYASWVQTVERQSCSTSEKVESKKVLQFNGLSPEFGTSIIVLVFSFKLKSIENQSYHGGHEK